MTRSPPVPPRSNATSWWLWCIAGLVAASVHASLGFIDPAPPEDRPKIAAKPKDRPMRVRMGRREPRVVKAALPPPIEKEPPLTGQIVTVRPPEVEKRPERTEYLADVDSSVAREKKARPSAKKRDQRPGAPARTVSPVQSPQSKSPEKTSAPATAPEVAVPALNPNKPESVVGPGLPESEVSRDQGSRLLVPVTDRESAIANIQTLTGSGVGNDYLPNVEDEGEETVLNSRRFQHWDFFHGIQERVRQNWRAGEVYQRRDPSGRVYGVKDRLTILRVTLDASGKVEKLLTVRDSGIDALDREARRALSVAAPFENPPKSMLDDFGRLTFQFSFTLELSTSRLRISRLPM